jgi:hypothetical protein
MAAITEATQPPFPMRPRTQPRMLLHTLHLMLTATAIPITDTESAFTVATDIAADTGFESPHAYMVDMEGLTPDGAVNLAR